MFEMGEKNDCSTAIDLSQFCFFFGFVFVMQFHAIFVGNIHPSGWFDVINTNYTTRVGITMCSMVN